VVAVNAGKVALVGEFFFPGRLVILDRPRDRRRGFGARAHDRAPPE
jgi:hypothetical protein